MKLSEFIDLTGQNPNKFKDFEINKFSIDSRNIEKGDVFVAIKTETNNGNLFAEDAASKGAEGFILSKKCSVDLESLNNVFLKKEPIAFLGKASGIWLEKNADKVIAITGSAGKTTTKALISHVLKTTFKAECSEGNYNNTIGLPLTILTNVSSPLDYYIAEMGMSFKGEINTLISFYKPNVRIWLNVLTAHLGNFENIDELREAKAEILNNRLPDDIIIFNNDNLLVKTRVQQEIGPKLSFGFSEGSDLFIKEFKSTLTETQMAFSFDKEDYNVKYNLSGKHNCYNVAAGILTSFICGVPFSAIKDSLETFQPVNQRGGVWFVEGITIYDDSYNSNPDALKSVLEMLSSMETEGRKVAVIGDMLELGRFSKGRHNEIGSFINNCDIDVVVCFGEEMRNTYDVLNDVVEKHWYPSSEAAAEFIKTIVEYNDVVVVKGSRGMKGEVIISAIEGD